jgi:uncharacterized membrane protein HdeD (DUF308 family)
MCDPEVEAVHPHRVMWGHSGRADDGGMNAGVAGVAVGEPVPVGKYWWIPLAAGVISIVFGIAAISYPGPTLVVVSVMIGAYMVLWGVMTVVRGVGAAEGVAAAVRILLGVITILAGLLMFLRPNESVLALAWVLGFWWTLSGILQLVRGIVLAEGRGWNIALGLIGLVVGIVILAQPEIGLITLVWIVAIGLLVQGVIEVAAGWKLRQLHKEGVV